MDKDTELINKILFKFKNFGEVHDYIIIDNMLYLSCHIKTDSPYFLVMEGGGILYKKYDYMNYVSAFNRAGYGNGFAIIDLKYWEIVKVFYFKDTLNYDCPASITYSCNDFIVLDYNELTYVFYLKDFTLNEIGASSYKIYEPYIIGFPYLGYHCYNQLFLLDTSTRKQVELFNIFSNADISEWSGNNLFIENEQLICVDAKQHKEHRISLDTVLGYKNTVERQCSFKDDLYNIKPIKEVAPYVAFTLGHITGWKNQIVIEDSSYIGNLLNLAKNHLCKDKIEELAQLIAKQIKKLYGAFDIIVPIPPSDLSREFQPLYEIVKRISEIINVPYDFDYLLSKKKKPIKLIDDSEERKKLLYDSLYISDDNRYRHKRILLIDDHIYKGDTLKTCIKKCIYSDLFVLVIARNYELSDFKCGTDYKNVDYDILPF